MFTVKTKYNEEREREKEKSIVRYCVTFTVCLQTPDQTLTVNRIVSLVFFLAVNLSSVLSFSCGRKKEKFSPASCAAHGCRQAVKWNIYAMAYMDARRKIRRLKFLELVLMFLLPLVVVGIM